MTRGERARITFALHRIALAEEKINQVEVFGPMGPDGLTTINNLKEAMCELGLVIVNDLEHSIELGRSLKEKA